MNKNIEQIVLFLEKEGYQKYGDVYSQGVNTVTMIKPSTNSEVSDLISIEQGSTLDMNLPDEWLEDLEEKGIIPKEKV